LRWGRFAHLFNLGAPTKLREAVAEIALRNARLQIGLREQLFHSLLRQQGCLRSVAGEAGVQGALTDQPQDGDDANRQQNESDDEFHEREACRAKTHPSSPRSR